MTFGVTCLAQPELFPESLEGDLWGDLSVAIDLPGGPYLFLGLEATQVSLLHEVFADRASSLDPSETLDVSKLPKASVITWMRRAARASFLDFERVDWKILIDVDYQPNGLRLAAHQWMGRIAWPESFHRECTLDSSSGDDLHQTFSGELWTPITEGCAFTDLFENYFRILVAYRLLATGGLLLHSAGVVDDAGGFVFPGASGNGKSTISKINRREGRLVLSDDGNALGLDHDADGRPRVWVEALPFGGEMRERPKPRGRFPLRRISALRKGPDNHLDLLSRASATSLLLGCSPFVNGDPHQTSRLLETIDTLLTHVPTSTLTFTKAGGFWNLFAEGVERPTDRPNPSTGVNP